ncbi:MAG: hypothetical protein C0620_07025 [Desulfuromonas sp.]|nr:MAG: hypothetical protein C0620_07025 [Desulfuromonas sp.]
MPGKKVSMPLAVRIARWSRRLSWPIVKGLFILSVVLFVGGGLSYLFNRSDSDPLQMLRWAKSLAYAAFLLGVIRAYWEKIRQRYRTINLQHSEGHVVVCGIGDFGQSLVDAFLDKGYKVAVIELNAAHTEVVSLKSRGVVVIHTDASDPAALYEVNASKARYLFAVTGNDRRNVKIIRAARQTVLDEQNSGGDSDLRCYCHITDATLFEVFSQHEVFEAAHDGFYASLFNVHDAASRFLLEKYPPDAFAALPAAGSEPLEVVIVGQTRMGEALIRQLARIGHYLRWHSVQITVIDKEADAFEHFFSSYRDISPLDDTLVPGVTVRLVRKDPEKIKFVADLDAGDLGNPALVCCCLDDETLNIALALNLRRMLDNDDAPIVACLTSGLSDLLQEKQCRYLSQRNIHSFNPYRFASDFQVLLDDAADKIARAIHQAYLDSLSGENVADNPSLVPWQQLSEEKKNANRWQADHLSVKLREMGYDQRGVAAIDAVVDDPVWLEKLSELEHRRWMAALYLDGWRYAETGKDAVRKTHACLVPYERLSQVEKGKDDTMIRNIKHLVESPEWQTYTAFVDKR